MDKMESLMFDGCTGWGKIQYMDRSWRWWIHRVAVVRYTEVTPPNWISVDLSCFVGTGTWKGKDKEVKLVLRYAYETHCHLNFQSSIQAAEDLVSNNYILITHYSWATLPFCWSHCEVCPSIKRIAAIQPEARPYLTVYKPDSDIKLEQLVIEQCYMR